MMALRSAKTGVSQDEREQRCAAAQQHYGEVAFAAPLGPPPPACTGKGEGEGEGEGKGEGEDEGEDDLGVLGNGKGEAGSGRDGPGADLIWPAGRGGGSSTRSASERFTNLQAVQASARASRLRTAASIARR